VNKDQLLDAIGMVDEQKIQDALTVKRTKRTSGIIAAATILFVSAVLIFLIGFLADHFHETVVDYTVPHIAYDIGNTNVVTVVPVPSEDSSRYTVVVPEDIGEVLRFEEWRAVDPSEVDGRETVLVVSFQGIRLSFYDGGIVCAQKYDWDDYSGVYAVPEELWQETLAVLANE